VTFTSECFSDRAIRLGADRKSAKVLADEAHVRKNVQLDVTYENQTK
jgi:hypothetical protein